MKTLWFLVEFVLFDLQFSVQCFVKHLVLSCLSFFIWSLCCLSCDIYVQILITPLISSNSSCFYLEFKSLTLTSMVIYVKCKRYRYLFKCSLFPFTFLFSSTITGLCNVNTFPFCILKSLCIDLFSCLFVFVSAADHYFHIQTDHYVSIWTGQVPALLFQIKNIIQQIVHVTSGHMAVCGPVRHQKNIIWTSVHIPPYDPQCHELLAIYFTKL